MLYGFLLGIAIVAAFYQNRDWSYLSLRCTFFRKMGIEMCVVKEYTLQQLALANQQHFIWKDKKLDRFQAKSGSMQKRYCRLFEAGDQIMTESVIFVILIPFVTTSLGSAMFFALMMILDVALG